MKIPPIEDYYFKNGIFKLKNPWIKKIKICMSMLILLGGMAVINETSSMTSPTGTSPEIKSNISSYIKSKNPELSNKEIVEIVNSTMRWSKEFKVDPLLVFAVQDVESGYKKDSISSAGALGLMQVIPSWHLKKLKQAKEDVGSPEIFNIDTNIYLGSWILRECKDKYHLTNKLLLCYNGSNSDPNGYDDKVMTSYKRIKSIIEVI